MLKNAMKVDMWKMSHYAIYEKPIVFIISRSIGTLDVGTHDRVTEPTDYDTIVCNVRKRDQNGMLMHIQKIGSRAA